MKYFLVLGDGMADEPLAELDNRTPLETADISEINRLAKMSEIGMVHTVPDGMKPGSDTANLSVLGYDPKQYYTGRSPLEALSIGVDLAPDDVAIRCNIVTLTESAASYEEQTMVDHSSGEIGTEEAAILLEAVKKELESDVFHYYVGTSYRHLLVWNKGEINEMIGPHEIPGQVIKEYLPKEPHLLEMMKKSFDILKDHPINVERKKKGLNPANSIWFWGAGTRPALSSFEEKNKKKGVMISAVDLLKGIGHGAGMKVIEVPGANGGLHTNYRGKAEAAVHALLDDGYDFAYIHVEAPDEMGHLGHTADKIEAIERIDRDVVKTITTMMEQAGEDYRMLIMPDHPTPIAVRTHTSDDVPYLLFDSTKKEVHDWSYNEKEGRKSGNRAAIGHRLIDRLFSE